MTLKSYEIKIGNTVTYQSQAAPPPTELNLNTLQLDKYTDSAGKEKNIFLNLDEHLHTTNDDKFIG